MKVLNGIETEDSDESKIGFVKNSRLKIKPSDFFLESTYLDGKGEIRPCCLLTKKGCDMVANKLTGQKGVLFTAAYVTAFEQMRERIKTGKALPDDESRTLRALSLIHISDTIQQSFYTQYKNLVQKESPGWWEKFLGWITPCLLYTSRSSPTAVKRASSRLI